MGIDKPSRRCLKLCCIVTTILVAIIVVVLIILAFTVLKPKEPEISVYPQGLEDIIFGSGRVSMPTNLTVNVTVGMVVAIKNPNYGSFKFKNTTALINYRGGVVAEVPIQHSRVPARGRLNISTDAQFMVARLVSNATFWGDVLAGSVNFTSETTVHGRVSVANILKLHASVPSRCEISILVVSRSIVTTCKSKVKL